MALNDNPALENEADVMGRKAASGNPIQRLSDFGLVVNQPKFIQSKSINDYNDSTKAKYDPSKISDTDIQATDENQELLDKYVRVPYIYTPGDTLPATRLTIRMIRDGGSFNVSNDGGDLMHKAHKQLEVLNKSCKYENKLK